MTIEKNRLAQYLLQEGTGVTRRRTYSHNKGCSLSYRKLTYKKMILLSLLFSWAAGNKRFHWKHFPMTQILGIVNLKYLE